MHEKSFAGIPGFSLSDCLTSDLSGVPFRCDRITVSWAGARSFALPTRSEQESIKEAFMGVIAYHHPLNEYHPEKYQFAKKAPVCVSYDGRTGDGIPGGQCASCVYNVSAGNHSVDGGCKSKRRLFVLLEHDTFPYELIVPANSLRNYVRYVRDLLSRGLSPNRVVTQFSVVRKHSKANDAPYSQMQFEMVRTLDADEQLFSQSVGTYLPNFVAQEADNRRGRMRNVREERHPNV